MTPDNRDITDEVHIHAYSGLVQACLEAVTVEVLVLNAWFVLRAGALQSLASGASPLRILYLDLEVRRACDAASSNDERTGRRLPCATSPSPRIGRNYSERAWRRGLMDHASERTGH